MSVDDRGGGGALAPPPPVLVFGGFLGSGKTSLILDFARWFTSSGGRLGILVNEAGTIGIDGTVLAAGGHRVREVFGGCVCCSLAGDLESGVRALAAFDIDLVILEPSGMAEVDRIAGLLETHGRSTVVVAAVIDAARLGLLRRAAGRLLESSVRAADFVLVNKVDMVDESALREARAWVVALRPEADVLEVSAERGVAPSAWSLLAETVVPEWRGGPRVLARGAPGLAGVTGRGPAPSDPSVDVKPTDEKGAESEEVARASMRLVVRDSGDAEGLARVVESLVENAFVSLGDGVAGHAKALVRRSTGGFYASITSRGEPVVVHDVPLRDQTGDPLGDVPGIGEAIVDFVMLCVGRTQAELNTAVEAGLSAVRSDPGAEAAFLRLIPESACRQGPG